MAEKRRRSTRTESAERKATEARRSAETDVGLLDNPQVQDEPSEIRHAAYFVAVIAFALVLNLVALVIAAGGR